MKSSFFQLYLCPEAQRQGPHGVACGQSSFAGSLARVRCDRSRRLLGTSLFVFFIYLFPLSLFVWNVCTYTHHSTHMEVIRVEHRLLGLLAVPLPTVPYLCPLVHSFKRIQDGGESTVSCLVRQSSPRFKEKPDGTRMSHSASRGDCSMGPPATGEKDKSQTRPTPLHQDIPSVTC